MLATQAANQYSRILDRRYIYIKPFDKRKDCKGKSIGVAFDTETNQCVIIKVLDTRRADEMAQEVAVHEFIPSDEPRLIKAI